MAQEIAPTPATPYRQRRVRISRSAQDERRVARTAPDNEDEFRRLWQALEEMRTRLNKIEPLEDVWRGADGGVWQDFESKRWKHRDFS